MKKYSVLILLMSVVSITAWSQQNGTDENYDPGSVTEMRIQRNIHLENDSDTEEVLLYIDDGTRWFELNVRSIIYSGKLTIQIFDSKGKKQGNFTIGAMESSKKKEQIRGDLNKKLNEPEVGEWRVRIIPDNVKGEIRIESKSYQ